MIEIAGGEPVSGLDGKSFLNVLTGKSKKHSDYVFAQATSLGVNGVTTPYAIRAVRDDQFKLILNLNHENEFPCNHDAHDSASGWRKLAQTDATARESLDHFLHRPEIELYDLKNDPWEKKNLATDLKYSDTVKRLRSKLEAWMKEQGDEGVATEMAVEKRQKKKAKKV